MKQLNFLSVLFLFISFTQVKCQENIFLASDNPAKCENIKEGKFLRVGAPITEWMMTIKDDVQTEYYNDGKDYVKSHLDFIDNCSYKATIVAKSDDKNPVKLGEVMVNKIIETDRSFIKLTSEYNTKTVELTLNKVEEK